MGDEKLKQELLYMVKLASKYDFTRMEVVEGILRLENERQILGSVFGKRFKARIFDIAAGQATDEKCVICGKHADNHVICQHCIDTIGDSDYAKSQFKTVEKPKLKLKFNIKPAVKINLNLKSCLQVIAIIVLVLLLIFQIWIAILWHSIPNYNPKEEPRNSSFEITPVTSVDEAYAQILLDFPEEEGYTVTFGRMDYEYVGRFDLKPGDCCLEIEEGLSDEERYDYFFTEDVYIFYISYLENHTGKVGMAEINGDGEIILEGSFNDGRRTDSFYKFR
ncbi:hypothetical protein SAMN04487830_102202 [Pseudobutyrivibrio sp. OR37]|uniref:hypothetical protein n=1 Tax=Pseudobutyrivibrio sp. OR37 TaxID=1798186 RepID=UPI0008EADC27|nr:hypothetical protein [Pseudobutyrivibrio sp. OR37]SFH59178.1 hypothetical protein SAMN04487830_102202 [Pseudobutyrivibrio sp. OR37]